MNWRRFWNSEEVGGIVLSVILIVGLCAFAIYQWGYEKGCKDTGNNLYPEIHQAYRKGFDDGIGITKQLEDLERLKDELEYAFNNRSILNRFTDFIGLSELRPR